MVRTTLILTASLLAIGAGAAVAAAPATWNSGYHNWWPGGFGYPMISATKITALWLGELAKPGARLLIAGFARTPGGNEGAGGADVPRAGRGSCVRAGG
jgi:hypothetical protein